MPRNPEQSYHHSNTISFNKTINRSSIISLLKFKMKTIFAIVLVASMATVIVSRQVRPAVVPEPVINELPELPEETKEVILEYVAEKMEDAYPNMIQEIQTRANLFNLSAYLNTNRPQNGTALTFVPLITLLSAFIGSSG